MKIGRQITAVSGDTLDADLLLQPHGLGESDDQSGIAGAVFVPGRTIDVADLARQKRQFARMRADARDRHRIEARVADEHRARFMGPAQPFVSAKGVRVAAERTDVHRNHADRLRPIDVKPDAARSGEFGDRPHGQHEAVGAGDVADLNDLRPRRHERPDAREILLGGNGAGFEELHRHAAFLGLVEPRERTARMRVRLKDHLVAGAQTETGSDEGVALGGIARETELAGLGSDKRCDDLPRRLDQVVTGLRMLLECEHRRKHRVEHAL